MTSYFEDSTLLDEALTLAQGLSDFVQGNDGNENEVNVLEITETLADMIDKQDKSEGTAIPRPRRTMREGSLPPFPGETMTALVNLCLQTIRS